MVILIILYSNGIHLFSIQKTYNVAYIIKSSRKHQPIYTLNKHWIREKGQRKLEKFKAPVWDQDYLGPRLRRDSSWVLGQDQSQVSPEDFQEAPRKVKKGFIGLLPCVLVVGMMDYFTFLIVGFTLHTAVISLHPNVKMNVTIKTRQSKNVT